jgi:hypothetical protein
VASLEQSRTFLDGFLTGNSAEGLLPNRFELGYCPECLGNDGWVFAASLEVSGRVVRWSQLGFDMESGFPLTSTGPWWRRTSVEPPADWAWWTLNPVDPELSFTFDRSQYEAAVAAEIERLRSAL